MNISHKSKKLKIIAGVVFLLFGAVVLFTGIQSIKYRDYFITVFLFVFFGITEVLGLFVLVSVPVSINYDENGIHCFYNKKMYREALWDDYKFAWLKLDRKGNLTIVLSKVKLDFDKRLDIKKMPNESVFALTIGRLFLASDDGRELLNFLESKYNVTS